MIVTLPDGSRKEAKAGEHWRDFIVREIGQGLAKSALAVKINDAMKDVSSPVEEGSLVVVTASSPDGLDIIRHSASHIMADAVTQLFPGTKVTIGPAIENGFYYDFDSDHRFTAEDLERIEAKMAEIIKAKQPFARAELSADEAKRRFAELGETYKVEIIQDLGAPVVSLYTHGHFTDLCRGPHLPDTGFVKAHKILSVAGAYWRGDSKNKMLQRIYGTAFADKKSLDDHLHLLEEARERDHRKLGPELDLFTMTEDIGMGLALWTPKGGVIRTVIENFWRREHYRHGYEIVYTPHIGRSRLWETSGHLGFYKGNMYSPMDIDGEDYYVKPMNCPFHIEVYRRRKWSYREFPIRWAELGTVYRYELSGVLNGLKRVRGFTQDDAHIFCRLDQLHDEIARVIDFSLFILRAYDFEQFKVYLSTRPAKDFVGDVAVWDKAEAALDSALKASGLPYQINPGDGAFYGPKIDIAVADAIGREWQLSTIQVDFNLPERFDLTYVGSDNAEHRPIMIHRALMGSLERFFGVLIEHYKGAFPVWLSPVQVAVVPVSEKHLDIAEKLENRLKTHNIRVLVDRRNEKTGYKVREWVVAKTPYIIVVGDKESSLDTVSVRLRSGEQVDMTLAAFEEQLDRENRGGAYF
ncbi:MAG TPA: threonine--tRNA ligase [bacterium]|nr:threonine--tRNA ligase [bacterium]